MGRPRREGTGLDAALKQEPGIRSQKSQEPGESWPDTPEYFSSDRPTATSLLQNGQELQHLSMNFDFILPLFCFGAS